MAAGGNGAAINAGTNNPMWRMILFAVFVLLAGAGGAPAKDCRPSSVGCRVMRLAGRVAAIRYPAAAAPAEYAYGAHFSGMVAVDAPPSAVRRPRTVGCLLARRFGCGLQSIAFTEELARRGYVVEAPDQADALLCHVAGPSPDHPPPQPNFFKPDTWNGSECLIAFAGAG
jgi:hypothetical protein